MRYWKTHKKSIIKKHLKEALDKSLPITLWQQFGDIRRTYQVSLIKIENNNFTFKISAESCKDELPVQEELPIYMHIPTFELIFTKERFEIIENIIHCTPPSSIQLYEKRRQDRFYYKYQDHKNITIQSEKRLPTPDGEDKPLYQLNGFLVDLSTNGAGFVVTNKQKLLIEKDPKIQLLNITDQKLPTPFKSEVAYMEPYDSQSKNDIKVGIVFKDALDSVSYKSITSIVEKKQIKVQGLTKDTFCGLDEEEQVRILYIIEDTNPALANNIRDNIEYLDKLRYLTFQMKSEFLQSIKLPLLAGALRLSSKELIYDLFIDVSTNIRDDFLVMLAKEKPASAICKSQDKVLEIVRAKEGTGEFILDPNTFIEYV